MFDIKKAKGTPETAKAVHGESKVASGYEIIISSAHKLPLSASLPNVLRLAESAGDKHLAFWSRLELLGYRSSNPVMTETTVVPEYRTVVGQWFDAYNRGLIFEDPKIGFINEMRIRLGVVELESFTGATGVIALQVPGPSDLIRQYFGIEGATFRFSPTVIPQVLANIKGQMLERLACRERVLTKKAPDPFVPTESGEILRIKLNLYGFCLDLDALWRRWRLVNTGFSALFRG